jgi:hypothetical protein
MAGYGVAGKEKQGHRLMRYSTKNLFRIIALFDLYGPKSAQTFPFRPKTDICSPRVENSNQILKDLRDLCP